MNQFLLLKLFIMELNVKSVSKNLLKELDTNALYAVIIICVINVKRKIL